MSDQHGCYCGHIRDEHEDGGGACTVKFTDLPPDGHESECDCILFEHDEDAE